MTKAFRLPSPCSQHTPFSQLHIWKWADKQEDRRAVTLQNYLTHIKFKLGTDRLTKEKQDLLRIRLINTLLHQYFINGGVLTVKAAKSSSFQHNLELKKVTH